MFGLIWRGNTCFMLEYVQTLSIIYMALALGNLAGNLRLIHR